MTDKDSEIRLRTSGRMQEDAKKLVASIEADYQANAMAQELHALCGGAYWLTAKIDRAVYIDKGEVINLTVIGFPRGPVFTSFDTAVLNTAPAEFSDRILRPLVAYGMDAPT